MTVWEVYTGRMPYPDLANNEVLGHIKNLLQAGEAPLPQPETMQDEVYSVTKKCLVANPTSRPHFADIVELLKQTRKNQSRRKLEKNMQSDPYIQSEQSITQGVRSDRSSQKQYTSPSENNKPELYQLPSQAHDDPNYLPAQSTESHYALTPSQMDITQHARNPLPSTEASGVSLEVVSATDQSTNIYEFTNASVLEKSQSVDHQKLSAIINNIQSAYQNSTDKDAFRKLLRSEISKFNHTNTPVQLPGEESSTYESSSSDSSKSSHSSKTGHSSPSFSVNSVE